MGRCSNPLDHVQITTLSLLPSSSWREDLPLYLLNSFFLMSSSSTSSADDNVDSPLPSSSSQRSSSNHYSDSHHHHFSPYILPTPTTRTQRKTEDEVSPFFVPVCAFAPRQLDHLRCVGLLPPLGPTTNDDNNDSNDNDDPLSLLYAIRLLRRAHGNYLRKALSIPLSRGYVSLDASHPWMVYWCLHSLDILGYFHDINNDNYDSNNDSNDSNDRGGAKKTKSMAQNIEEKHNLLLRVVSTLQYCWNDVDISLDHPT